VRLPAATGGRQQRLPERFVADYEFRRSNEADTDWR